MSSVFQERNLLAATGKAAIRNSLALTSSHGIGEHTQGKRNLSARCVTGGLCAATTSPSTHGDTWPPRRSHPGKRRCGTSTRSPQPRPCPLAQHYRSACCCQPQTDCDGDWTLNPHQSYAGTRFMRARLLIPSWAKNVIMHWTLCCTYFALCNGTFCLLLCKRFMHSFAKVFVLCLS